MNFRASLTKEDQFDEWFVGYSFKEDVDLSYRISRKTRIVMIPDAKLWHYSSPANRLDFERLKKMEAKNHHYVFRKHKDTHLLSGVIFIYSLLGSVGIDLLEFLKDRDPLTFRKFRAGLLAYFDTLRNPPR
jgi:GT2 family glycosyltransferase